MNFFKNRRTYSFGLMFALVGILLAMIPAGAPTRKQPPSPAGSQADPAMPFAGASLATAAATGQRRAGEYGKLPMSFESNQGQTDRSVNFLARGKGYSLFLTSTAATFVMANQSSSKAGDRLDQYPITKALGDATSNSSAVLRMKVFGGNDKAEVKATDELAGKVNYFVGNDPTKWRTNVPTFSRVRYSDVYEGIDLVYYGNQRQLEYDFVVAPGKDARAIALEFGGATKVSVAAATGDLLVQVGENEIRQQKPFVYQEIAGRQREVASRYAIKKGGQVGFEIGAYDRSAPLIIDPVLLYSTYLGGSGDEIGYDIALDSTGNMYVAGSTTSTNFPTAVAFQSTAGGGLDAFVSKLNPAGTALVYSTYIGSSGGDVALAIAVDSAGNAYVTGVTASTAFPTANALQSTIGGLSDVFVTKLNAAGSALAYSTYLGGSGNESGFAIDVDSAGNAYVTGPTGSLNFPTANALQGTKGDSNTSINDVFLTKLNAAGSALVYSTYLGGSSDEKAQDIAVDSAGSAYIAGVTFSNNFPTANALQGTIKGSLDAFVTKVNVAGSALVYSTYLGGTVTDQANSIKVDSAGNAYVTGTTNSDDFPTANALQGTKGRFNDAFVTKLNATGSALAYSTFVGGSDDDTGFGLALDSTGAAYVTGGAKSTDFPMANAFQGTKAGDQDAYVMKLNAAGSALVYSTYLGGAGFDEGHKIAVDGSGNAYVSGATLSTNFPTANPLRSTNGGSSDAFVAKIGEVVVSTVQFSLAAYTVQEDYNEATLTVTRVGDTSGTASVDYQTSDSGALFDCGTSNGLASQRCDFSTASGTVNFASGETSKDIKVLINEDSYIEGSETFGVSLSSPVGAALGAPATATVTITDDASEPAANPIDSNDAFVQEHYHDFLSRQPDADGLSFWTAMITSEATRVDVSKSFFDSQEFGDTGFFVYRLYRASFGNLSSPNQTRANVTYADFMNDRARVIGGANMEQLRQALADAFVLRARFLAEYPANQTNTQFVNHLFDQASLTPFTSERQTETDAMNNSGRTRAQVLRDVIEIQALKDREKNPAFVLMQYFGYLRRDPDQPGFDFWLSNIDTLNRAKGMVCAFITSREYQERFGTQVTRNNVQCGSILNSRSGDEQ